MIKIFYGDDRVRAERMAKRVLGAEYEVIEGADLEVSDMPNIFLGNSLFFGKRSILIKDLGENKICFEKIGDFLNTEHIIVLLESKFDKRTSIYKKLKEQKIEIIECKLPEIENKNRVFDIFDLAWAGNGARAVKLIENIEKDQDAFMYIGLLVTQVSKKFEQKQGNKEIRALRLLSKLDMQTKSSQFEPWELVKCFILQISQL